MIVLENEYLKNYTNYRIGGKVNCLIIIEDEKEIYKIISLSQKSVKLFILGDGTNVLFSDKGFSGTVVKIALKDIKEQKDGLFVSAGVSMTELLNFCLEKGFSGLEWAGGLPGTVGGAIRGNAGAFGGEMKDSILAARSINLDSNKPVIANRSCKDCLFGYRDSIFKHNNEIILGATLRFKNRDKKEIEEEINGHILYRKEHQPLKYPSAGSTFKNIPLDLVSQEMTEEFRAVIKKDLFPVIPAAAVLDKLGLKGRELGGAQISEKHPNFFVNKNNASCGDVIGLINLAKEKALEKYGIELKEEIEIISK